MDRPRQKSDAAGTKRSRFVSFAERVERLDINPLHRTDFLEELKGVSDDLNSGDGALSVCITGEEMEIMGPSTANLQTEEVLIQRRIYEQLKSTYFDSALKYWKGRNISHDFTICSSRLFPICRSLPQLIHHLTEIVDILLEYIKIPNSSAQEPAYHLLAILARVSITFIPFIPSVIHITTITSPSW